MLVLGNIKNLLYITRYVLSLKKHRCYTTFDGWVRKVNFEILEVMFWYILSVSIKFSHLGPHGHDIKSTVPSLKGYIYII